MATPSEIESTDVSSAGHPGGCPGVVVPVAPLPMHRNGVSVRVLMALVRAYRLFLSPWLGSSCRFEPTCSAYALQALAQHGAASGARLTLVRLARCHPWCAGGCDPVPGTVRPIFSALLGSARLPAQPEALPGVVSPSRKN